MICVEDVFPYLLYIRHRNVRNELRTLDADRSSGEFKYTLVFLLPALALDRCALSWYFHVQSAFLRSSSQQRPIPGNWAVLLKPSVEIRQVAERLAWSIMCKRSTSLVVFIAFLLHFQKCDFLQLRLFSAVCGKYTIMFPKPEPCHPSVGSCWPWNMNCKRQRCEGFRAHHVGIPYWNKVYWVIFFTASNCILREMRNGYFQFIIFQKNRYDYLKWLGHILH